jgi:hypothetical protein
MRQYLFLLGSLVFSTAVYAEGATPIVKPPTYERCERAFDQDENRIRCLQRNIQQLEDYVEALIKLLEADVAKKIANVSAGAIRGGDHIRIESVLIRGKCLDPRSNPNPVPSPDDVRMVTCQPTDPENRWILHK